MENKIALRPSYWASVSGGKDSLYMLKLILSHPEQYPLDGVVHFELEIDYPFIKNVIDYMENECKKHGIKFLRIKPRKSWYDIYNKRGFPGKIVKWCNSEYKLDSKRQLEELIKKQGLECVHYIGYCRDEKKRFEKRKENGITEIYPLVDYDINENYILQWAKTVDLFNDYYKINKRCGCMYCPCARLLQYAYTLKYYPDNYKFMINAMKNTEKKISERQGKKYCISGNEKYDAEYIDNIVKIKWLPKLEKMLEQEIIL